MKIKVCGMRNPDNVREAGKHMPDFMGFIFYPPSPRYVPFQEIKKMIVSLNQEIKRVGVFVNQPLHEIVEIATQLKLDYVQLHGNEPVELAGEVKAAGVKVIKAFQMKDNFDWNQLESYALVSDFFLFDSPTPNYGGSGLKFNWNKLKNYQGETSFFLSGGIGVETLSDLKKLEHPQLFGIDINSCIELEPGLKDIHQLRQLINEVRNEEVRSQ